MSEDSVYIESYKATVEDLVAQLRTIKSFPCDVTLYDRVFIVSTPGELFVLIQGLEVGSYFKYRPGKTELKQEVID